MDFASLEFRLEGALDQLAALMDGDEDFQIKPEWATALQEVVRCLGDIANSADARRRLVDAVSYHWFGKPPSAIQPEVRDEVSGIVGLALAFQINLHAGDHAVFHRNALVSVYRRFLALGSGKKWRVATAFSLALGSPFEPHYGGLINEQIREQKPILRASGHVSLNDEPRAPEVHELLDCEEHVLAAVQHFVRQRLRFRPKQRDAVLAHLEGRPVKQSGNLRLGINNAIVDFLHDWLVSGEATPTEIDAMVAIVRGQKAALREVDPGSIAGLRRLMAGLPVEGVRAVLQIVPRDHVKAWMRNATIAGMCASPFLAATASATMMV